MLNHLFATILICLGVANTTPISNYNHQKSNIVLTTPKKENIIQNYTIDIQKTQGNTSNITWNYTGSSEYAPNPYINYVNDYEKITKLTGTSNYLNITGNAYTSIISGSDSGTTYYRLFQEYYNYMSYEIINECASTMGYLLKITPYNFNKDTKIRLRVYLYIGTEFGYEQIQNIYLNKRVYTTTENLDDYIGIINPRRQLTKEINEYITNVNNGFFYTEDVTMRNLNTNSANATYSDDTEITITPNIDNYIFIRYTPTIYIGDNVTEWEKTVRTRQSDTIDIGEQNPNITGTNIIPDGTYEVIDIPGLMYEVIGMPFAFVSQAFNLTLFPGTPYQINIANLFLSIAAIFVFVWLLLLFIKMKG